MSLLLCSLMRRICFKFLIALSLAKLVIFAAAPPQVITGRLPPRFDFKDGDVVALIGDTLIEREQTYGYFETELTESFPRKNIIFRNLGWSADTPLGESRASFDPPEKGFDRLKEHLAS